MQRDVVGRLALQLLLQSQGGVAGHEEFHLVLGHAAAHLVQTLAQVGFLVTHDLGGRVGQGVQVRCRAPGLVAGWRPGQVVLVVSGHVVMAPGCVHPVAPFIR